MHIHGEGYVSIVELIVYIPSLILAIILCCRHGFTRASGWVYTVVLCIARIAGAICQLLTYSNDSTSLLQATLIIDSIGLSPLLLATLGMLSRSMDWINMRGAKILSINHFRILQLLITVGLILAIVGGTSSSTSDNGTIKTSTTSKVGIILYIVVCAGLLFVLYISTSYRTFIPKQERRIVVAVAIAFPFILVRLAYAALAVFLNDHLFSVVGGSVAVHVGMAVIEEFIVVIDYLILGFGLQKLQAEEQGELASRPWKDGGSRGHKIRRAGRR